MRKVKIGASLVVAAVLVLPGMDAAVVAGWNFNGGSLARTAGTSGTMATEVVGLSVVEYQSFPVNGTLIGALPGDAAGRALAFIDLITLVEVGEVAMTGLDFTDLNSVQLSFAVRDFTPGIVAQSFHVDYNVGSGWQEFGAFTAPDTDWELRTINLSSVSALNGVASAGLRIRFAELIDTVDVLEFDNITVTAVPEPWLAGVLSVAVLAGAATWRRRKVQG